MQEQQHAIDNVQSDFNHTLVHGSIKGAMRMAGAGSSDLWKVPRNSLRVIEGFNVRVHDDAYEAHVRKIADSMKNLGYDPTKPMAGYVAKEGDQNVIYITDGHTRLQSVDLANSEGAQIELIPIITTPQSTSLEDLTVKLVTSNNGKQLTTYEVAVVAKRLVGFGWDEAKIATNLGFGEAHIRNLLSLMGAPREVREMVQAGTVSVTTAVEMLRKHGSEVVDALKKGLEAAKAAGKQKVTNKHVVDPYQKFIKRNATAYADVTTQVKADPNYASLSEETRAMIEQLVAKAEQAKVTTPTPENGDAQESSDA